MSNLDKNKESGEENNKQKESKDLKWKFIKEFSKDILSWSDKNTFLDETMKKDSIESGSFLEQEINKFQAKNSEFNDFDQKKITIYDLQRQVGKQYSSLEYSRASYLENTFSNYNLSFNQQEKLEKEISKKSENDLNKLINLESENNKLINKIFGENKIDKISNFNFLDDLSENDIKNRLEILSESDKHSVKTSLSNLKNLRAGDVDIRELFSTNFLNKNEKKEILSKFIPYLSLAKAKELWILDNFEAEKKKKDILKPLLKKNWLSWDILSNALKSSSLEDIKIKSSEFFSDEINLNIISQWVWFTNFEKDLKNFTDEVKKDIEKKGPQNLEELKQLFSLEDYNWTFENIGNFKEWNIIKTITKNKEWKEEISYGKITEISDINKEVKIRWVWSNESWNEIINLDVGNIADIYNFTDLISSFKAEWKKAIFYTDSEIQKLIEDPKNNISNSDLRQYTHKDLQDNPELSVKLQEKYRENIEKERQVLEDEILEIENEIGVLKKSKNSENKDEVDSKIEILNIKLKNKKLRFSAKIESTDSSISTNDLLQYSNKLELNKKLDEIDSEWKWIELEKWCFIETKWWLYKITGIDWEDWYIHLESNWKKWPQKEKLTFEEFYQAFKKNKANRLKSLESLDDLLKSNQENSEVKGIWDKYKVENWVLKIKEIPEYSKDKNPEVEYLISDNSNEIYKIEKISDWKITFRIWERKKVNSLDEKEKSKYKNNIKIWKDWKPEIKNWKVQYEGELLSINKDTETISLSEFNKLINKKKEEFHPDWQTWKDKTISNPQDTNNNISSHFMTKLFGNFSFWELMDGLKMLGENIEEYFKKWNEIHAAKIALAMGKILPDELEADLLIKVERAEDESMEKEIEALGKVDSPIATARIKDWLLNKNTPEFKKEAWLLFMIKKYGHLNSKKLTEFSGKFLWYEAFWGKIWDELFLDIKKEAEWKNQTFTEEYLMYIFIKKQCWDSWYAWVKRRSRLHKTFKSSWPSWVEDEIKTGHTDASDERTARAMVDGWIWEMTGWTISNAIWWFQKAIERGWSLEEMSEGFFTLLYSGAIYNVDQKTYLKIKWLWDWEQMPMIMARFSSFKSDMQLFNNTVFELSKRIWEEYSDEFPNIAKEAKELFDDANWNHWSDANRMKRAQAFWKKYWTPLSRSLNMSHTWDNSYSKTDKIIYLESENNPIFKKYYDSVRGFATEWTFKKEFMEDAMWSVWITWLNTNQVTKQFLKMDVWGSMKEWLSASNVWKWISDDIKSVANMDLDINKKKQYLLKTLRDVTSWFVSNHWWREDALRSYNNNTSNIWQDLNSWGINIYDDLWTFSPWQINDESNEAVNKLLNKIVNNILSWTSNNSEWFQSWFKPVNNIKNKIKDTLSKRWSAA